MSLTSMLILLGVLVFASVLLPLWVKRRVQHIYANTQRVGAIAHSECMIRNGMIECPGVACVLDGHLVIRSIFGTTLSLPLSGITVTREAPGTGKYGWWGKHVLYLDTPETTNLAIGVKDPEPFRKALMSQTNLQSTKQL